MGKEVTGEEKLHFNSLRLFKASVVYIHKANVCVCVCIKLLFSL